MSFCFSDALSVGALLTLLDYFKIVKKDILTKEIPDDCPQSIIIYTGDVWTTQDSIIHAEGSKLCVTNDLVFAFELLLIVHYVFNISYAPKAKRLLTFLQVADLHIQDSEPLPKSMHTLMSKLAVADQYKLYLAHVGIDYLGIMIYVQLNNATVGFSSF